MTDDNYHFYCGSVEISVFTGKCCLINDVEILLMTDDNYHFYCGYGNFSVHRKMLLN